MKSDINLDSKVGLTSDCLLQAKNMRSMHALRIFGIVLLIYAVLAAAAAVLFPSGFNPLTNTLQQLGNSELNPSGAILYNIGVFVICGMTLLMVIILLVSPKQWLTSRGAKRRVLFYFTLAFMFLFTLFYVVATLVPSSSDYGLNSLLTLLFIVFFELFVVCSALGIRRLKDYVAWIPRFGFAVAVINLLLVVASAVSGFSLFSWILSVLSWSYMVAFFYEFSATSNEPTSLETAT